MPFSTDSTSTRSLFGSSPDKSIHPMTWPSLGRDARDPVRVPNVGVDLTLGVLQFVQLIDRLSTIVDYDVANLAEASRIAKANGGCPIATTMLAVRALIFRIVCR
jgi:hypothetical protein